MEGLLLFAAGYGVGAALMGLVMTLFPWKRGSRDGTV
jgi:hypothetical protein